MPKYTLTIDQPGDRWDLPYRVTFRRVGLPDTFEYRTTGTISEIRQGAEKIKRRLEAENRVVHLRI